MTRRDEILKLIVEHFIKTAEPVGSKTLQEVYHLDVSSATIRNEMNALEQDGYLEKTHTSSGRVPSEKGYQYYAEHIRETGVDEQAKNALANVLSEKSKSVEEVMKEACEILSHMVKEAEENKEADQKRKDDIEVKNKAQTYVDEINTVLNDPAQSAKLSPEQKAQLTTLRDEAQGAIQSNNTDKLREIVGKLEDAASQAAAGQYQQQAGANPNAGAANNNAGANPNASTSSEGHEGPDDVVDADFTDKKK